MAQSAPLLPTQVAKALNTNSLLASAMLSELTSKGLLKASSLKVGSSPLYYSPEKSDQLQNYVQYLNSKDKTAYDLLKEKKVLRENDLDPLTRVAVKNIKDFSRPLEVTFGGKKEIFWKFYLLSDSDAEPVIKQLLNIESPVEQKQQPEVLPEAEPLHEKETAAETIHEIIEEEKESVQEQPSPKPAPRQVEQKKLVEKAQVPRTAIDASDPFLKQLLKFFQKNNISVIEQKLIKKKSDYEFIIELSSAVGSLTYFCKAKNKKRVSEGDLSSAFVQGQLKKLPVILLSPGELTKQAKDISKELKGVAVKKL